MKQKLSVITFFLIIGAFLWVCTSSAIPPMPSSSYDGTGVNITATTANITTLTAATANITGGNVTGIMNLGAANATLTGANVTTLNVNGTLGTELITWTDAGWNEDASTWTFAGGVLTHVTGNTTAVTATLTGSIVAGSTYKVVISGTGGGNQATWTLGGVQGVVIPSAGAFTITDYVTTGTTASFIITPNSNCTVAISSISIKLITSGTGNLTVEGNLKAGKQIYAGSANATGTTSVPAYSFLNAPNSGLSYSASTGNFNLIKDSATSLTVGTSGIYVPSSSYIGWTGTYLYHDADYKLTLRATTNQQTYEYMNTYTNSTNYEGGQLTGVQGSSINLTAVTAGTGADNVDIVLTPAGTGIFKTKLGSQLSSTSATTGGGMSRRVAETTSGALSGSSGSIAVNVPSGARILGVQLRVDTTVTFGGGGATWTAVYVNTPTTAICSGQNPASGTKFNAIHPAYEITTDTVTITLTPDTGTFSGGVIRAVVYYEMEDPLV
jgi:hypothetical protein